MPNHIVSDWLNRKPPPLSEVTSVGGGGCHEITMMKQNTKSKNFFIRKMPQTTGQNIIIML